MKTRRIGADRVAQRLDMAGQEEVERLDESVRLACVKRVERFRASGDAILCTAPNSSNRRGLIEVSERDMRVVAKTMKALDFPF